MRTASQHVNRHNEWAYLQCTVFSGLWYIGESTTMYRHEFANCAYSELFRLNWLVLVLLGRLKRRNVLKPWRLTLKIRRMKNLRIPSLNIITGR